MFNILLQKIISAVDADKNGTIEFDEFIDFFMNLGPKIQTWVLRFFKFMKLYV